MTDQVAPVRTYLLVWAALLALLALSLGSAFLPLGGFNLAVNLILSVTQMLLLMAFFMHLRVASPLLRIFAAIGFVWLMFLFILSLADYLSRARLPSPW
jgi:cytochrome c oxidase subunit IV